MNKIDWDKPIEPDPRYNEIMHKPVPEDWRVLEVNKGTPLDRVVVAVKAKGSWSTMHFNYESCVWRNVPVITQELRDLVLAAAQTGFQMPGREFNNEIKARTILLMERRMQEYVREDHDSSV